MGLETPSKRTAYLFSGLGANERVFELLDLSFLEVVYIKWITPGKSESIESYAKRLLNQVEVEHPIYIGISFGGIIAQEVSKLKSPKRLILISSAYTYQGVPGFYRFFGNLNVHKLLPSALLKSANPLTYWLFGVSDQTQQRLLKEILKETDATFMKWAIDQIVKWRSLQRFAECTTIHGTKDWILPNRKADFIVESGGHFMIVSKSTEISSLIHQVLK